MRRGIAASMLACLLAQASAAPVAPLRANEVLLPGGAYTPVFARYDRKSKRTEVGAVKVPAFRLDRMPVTNAAFRAFLIQHPQWWKSRIAPLFADRHYLSSWRSDLSWGEHETGRQPVTGISWFAAKAYCEARGGDLPTTDQWEYALADGGHNQAHVRAQSLAWFSVPGTHALPAADVAPANGYGVRGLVGLVWEWTLDFQSVPTGSDARAGASSGFFCGGASVGALDPSDYAAFMRFSFRSSLKASYTTKSLGFRCAAP